MPLGFYSYGEIDLKGTNTNKKNGRSLLQFRSANMATLHKFKILATQCAVAGSPTRSPTTSPVIHLRRRKTLRMLLSGSVGGRSRRFSRREDGSPERRRDSEDSSDKRKELVVSHKLKDLFVSSPPSEERSRLSDNAEAEMLIPATACVGSGGAATMRAGPRLLRPLSATFRQRLLRRAWRPVLVTIPE